MWWKGVDTETTTDMLTIAKCRGSTRMAMRTNNVSYTVMARVVDRLTKNQKKPPEHRSILMLLLGVQCERRGRHRRRGMKAAWSTWMLRLGGQRDVDVTKVKDLV